MKNLQNESFMIRCLKSAASPSGVCRYAHTFSWLQLSFLFLFLTASLMAPLTVSFIKMDRFDVASFMPTAIQQVNDQFADQLQGFQIRNGKLTGGKNSNQIEEGQNLLAIDTKHEYETSGENGRLKVTGYDNAIIFQSDQLVITDQNGTGFSVGYANLDAEIKEPNVHDVEILIDTLWLAQYKPMIMMLAYTVIFLIQLFLTAVLAGGIWITKNASFKEAATMAICASALPAFTAAAAGMVHFDLITVLMIHSCGVILMISFTFRSLTKTRRYNGNLHSGGNDDKSAVI
ncbi:maltodextrin utilization protein yvdJ [Bacillus subtilis]|nr:maltodextrin utilization protein yvdJ [Bacillus subtilis]